MSDVKMKQNSSDLLKVAVWIVISSTVILYNKFLLSFGGFPYPVLLTLLHQLFSGVAAWALQCYGVKGAEAKRLDLRTMATKIAPISVLFALVLWLGNTAYLYMSVSTIQMTKAFMPPLVYTAGLLLGIERCNCRKSVVLLVITCGTLVAAYGEVHFHWFGFCMLFMSLVFEAVRTCLLQLVLQHKSLEMNPLQTLMYVAPMTALSLIIIALPFELKGTVSQISVDTVLCLHLLGNCCCAFALNLAVFKIIKNLNALTLNIAGILKDCLLVSFSFFVFRSPVTGLQLCGYAVALIGIFKYNQDRSQQ